MNLVFERSKGRFGSNSNILALAWMPYHNEVKFRQALFEYHQRQLMNLSSNQAAARDNGGNNINGPQALAGDRDAPPSPAPPLPSQRGHLASRLQEQLNRPRNQNRDNNRPNNANLDAQTANDFYTARLAELYQRYLSLNSRKRPQKADRKFTSARELAYWEASDICKDLDRAYGRMPDFGWLVIGNIGQLIGITLTSIVDEPPIEVTPTSNSAKDLINFDGENSNNTKTTITRAQIMELLNKTVASSSSIDDFGDTRPDRKCVRSNYNLRGHLDEVIMVKWNELYQKLATVDLKGNVLIWCKVNDKFIIQTPFYNRTKSVADFQWSNDGKTALICYTDSFILVGSSSGQRHWHSMLNLDDYHITCAAWTPNDDQLLLGVSNGNIVIIDLPRSDLTEVIVNQTNIRSMAWSSTELTFDSLGGDGGAKTAPAWQAAGQLREIGTNLPRKQTDESPVRRNSSTVVNHRQLPRDCSVFSRYRLCSQGPTASGGGGGSGSGSTAPETAESSQAPRRQDQQQSACLEHENILAVDFSNNTIELFSGGLSDPAPRSIDVKLDSYMMQWASNGRLLAVAGFNINTSAPSVGMLRCRYLNTLKFYNTSGKLVYERRLRCNKYPVTAFTWAHNDSRIFLATGPRLHCAKVLLGIQKLSQLAMSKLQRQTKLPDKYDAIKAIAQGRFGSNIMQWQSRNCPIELGKTASSQLASSSSSSSSSGASGLVGWQLPLDDGLPRRQLFQNNANVYAYSLPLKLLKQVDQLCSNTIRQPFDESWSASDIVWHVPACRKRIFCTLVCYTSDRNLGLATPSHAKRADWADRQLDANVTTDQNKIFVLYVEFQGSFLPILRARRIGFLKPEFVIFDPDDGGPQTMWPRKSTKVSDVSASPYSSVSASKPQSDRGYFRDGQTGCSSADCTSRLQSSSTLRQQQRDASRQDRLTRSIGSSYTSAVKGFALAERDELVRVRSNIWGTKFKIINNSNRMIRQRALLGSVEYKASILHLQPREICLITKDMSNYCCLCSKHHHSRQSQQTKQVNNPASSAATNGIGQPATCDNVEKPQLSLLDMPNVAMHSWRGEASLSPARKQLHSPRREHDSRGSSSGSSQHGRAAVAADIQDSGSSRRQRQYAPVAGPSHLPQEPVERLRPSPRRLGYLASTSVMLPYSVMSAPYYRSDYRVPDIRPDTSDDEAKDDILTVSLSQREPIKLELKPHSSYRDTELANKKAEADRLREEQILGNNKTLKSIRNITQMIVDLSSKSDEDNDSPDRHSLSGGSPSKLVRLSPQAEAASCRVATFIPETPVHRPRRILAKHLEHSQSVHNSPVHQRRHLIETGPVSSNQACNRTRPRGGSSRRSSGRNGIDKDGIRDRNSDRKTAGKLEQTRMMPPLQQASVELGRRLSLSARRLFGGSLRSLSRMNTFSGSETEIEDCEPLVSTHSSCHNNWTAASPSRSASTRAASFSNSIKSQVSQRLGKYPDVSSNRTRASSSTRAELSRFECGSRPPRRKMQADYEQTMRDFSDSDSSSSVASDGSLDESQLFELHRAQKQQQQQQQKQQQQQQQQHQQNRGSRGHRCNSARDLRSAGGRQDQLDAAVDRRQQQQQRPIRDIIRKRSICNKSNCCCAKEFKLANRAPLWNELSQVYQLDFGGRVTQESAKNLQIDLDGSLALQFGRIDNCTYTLDYSYPFNAVQAMSVALASLTQRLK